MERISALHFLNNQNVNIMKEKIKWLSDNGLTPVPYFVDDSGKVRPNQEAVNFESLNFAKVAGVGVKCGSRDIFALRLRHHDKNNLKVLLNTLHLGDDYQWQVQSSSGARLVVFRVLNVPSKYLTDEIKFSGASLAEETSLATFTVIPLTPVKINGFDFSPLYDDITERPYEMTFEKLLENLGHFVDVSPLREPEHTTSAEPNADEGQDEAAGWNTPVIPERVYEKLPRSIKNFTDQRKDQRQRDMVLLSSLATYSAIMPNVYIDHGTGERFFTPLNVFVTAPPASGKNSITPPLHLTSKIEQQKREKFEAEMREFRIQLQQFKDRIIPEKPVKPKLKTILVGGDSSFSAMYHQLVDNEEWGLIFETEADTLLNSSSQDWGKGLSSLIRKCFAHEPHIHGRVTNDTQLRLNHPCLSVVMSGTSSQFFNFLNSTEDGLFSRVTMYCFERQQIDLVNPFVRANKIDLTKVYDQMASEALELYNLLYNQPNGIEFRWTQQQGEKLFEHYKSKFEKSTKVFGVESTQVSLRHWVMGSRLGMILTTLEQFAAGTLGKSNVIEPGDHIMQNVIDIIDCCLEHALLLFKAVESTTKKRSLNPKSLRAFQLLAVLPDKRSFQTKDAIEAGRNLKFSKRSVSDYLAELVANKLLERTKNGEFRKLK